MFCNDSKCSYRLGFLFLNHFSNTAVHFCQGKMILLCISLCQFLTGFNNSGNGNFNTLLIVEFLVNVGMS
jgi:hypothetical protein